MQDLQIMTDNLDDKYDEELIRELNNICDECKKEDESVSQNLILTPGFLLLAFITYAWYNTSLIIGLKIFLNYDSYIKTTFVSLAPQIMFFLFIFSSFQKNTIAFS